MHEQSNSAYSVSPHKFELTTTWIQTGTFKADYLNGQFFPVLVMKAHGGVEV